MALNAVSSAAFSSQGTLPLPCHLMTVRKPSCIIRLLPAQMRNSTPRASAFYTPKENDKAVRDYFLNCVNDEIQFHLEEKQSCDDSSASYSDVSLLEKLQAIQMHILESQQWNASKLQLCHRKYLASATNMIHYMAFRSYLDCDDDPNFLLSLFNWETIKSHVLASLTANIQLVKNLKSNSLHPEDHISSKILYQEQNNATLFNTQEMRKKASSNRELLFGQFQDTRTPHIMVTVGQEAIESESLLITDLINAGTTLFRINCAHGNPSTWSEIIRRVREISQMLKKPCRILMDLAGPKLRTGTLKTAPSLMKISPKKTTEKTSIRLRIGDLLIVSRGSFSDQNEFSSAQRITCSSGYLFDSVKPGDSIAFDDGKIWGKIVKIIGKSEIVVSITHASPKGTKLKPEKSINIPESNIQFEGLTSKDLMDLEFVADNADIVGLSFVRHPNDISVLRRELEKRKLENLGIILKIETKSAFEKLPLLLLEAMKCGNPLGVMIARGDLAVECGWEKMADLQEEIITICEAAQVPVIWATQVLESLVKFGIMPTRAEITDAATAMRASCVMLNKGKYIVRGVSSLEKILHPSTKMKPDYLL
ncbi:plastidial pyruvate kinase 4, chloroplastic-like isoform X2 [Euphorbia lathyris]|uniref:plastidial pyruvate kinase 4, chloroplastic-like isoform X2 n=1 Tax=Euphorbia lathyris TaxID=212925 RepID=UPI003313C340